MYEQSTCMNRAHKLTLMYLATLCILKNFNSYQLRSPGGQENVSSKQSHAQGDCVCLAYHYISLIFHIPFWTPSLSISFVDFSSSSMINICVSPAQSKVLCASLSSPSPQVTLCLMAVSIFHISLPPKCSSSFQPSYLTCRSVHVDIQKASQTTEQSLPQD